MMLRAGRRYCDAYSHVQETVGWVAKHADPQARAKLHPVKADLRRAGEFTPFRGRTIAVVGLQFSERSQVKRIG
jgi:hypothetical protein